METLNDFASASLWAFLQLAEDLYGSLWRHLWAPSNLIISVRWACDFKKLIIPLVLNLYQAKHVQRGTQSLDFGWIWFPLNSDDPSKAAVMNCNALKWKPFLPIQAKMFITNFSPTSETLLVAPVSLPVVFASHRQPLRRGETPWVEVHSSDIHLHCCLKHLLLGKAAASSDENFVGTTRHL